MYKHLDIWYLAFVCILAPVPANFRGKPTLQIYFVWFAECFRNWRISCRNSNLDFSWQMKGMVTLGLDSTWQWGTAACFRKITAHSSVCHTPTTPNCPRTSEPRVFTVPAWALKTFECKSIAHQQEGAIPVMSKESRTEPGGWVIHSKTLDVEVYL